MDEIKRLLDEHCVWVNNQDVVARVKFALELLEQYEDALANYELGLTLHAGDVGTARPASQSV